MGVLYGSAHPVHYLYALDPFTGKRDAGTRRTGKDDFPGDVERLKLSVIRPAFETIGNGLKERGHESNKDIVEKEVMKFAGESANW